MSEWQPIETAPENERVIVCGWQARHGNTQGYWWYHEDVICDGKPIEHPSASHWVGFNLPEFPEPPETA